MVIISDRSHQVNISFTLSAPTHPSRGYAWERRHLACNSDSSQSSSGSAGILPAIQIPPNHLLGAQASCLQLRFLPIISWERRHPACNSVQIPPNHLLGAQASCLQFRFLPIISWERRHLACNSDSFQSSPGSAGILPAIQCRFFPIISRRRSLLSRIASGGSRSGLISRHRLPLYWTLRKALIMPGKSIWPLPMAMWSKLPS